MTCENCVSFKVCHAVALAGKVVNAEVRCDYFIDKDLINRQKAEIKRLQKIEANILDVMRENIEQTKAEAFKEFAEIVVCDIDNYCEKNIKTKPFVDGVTGMQIAHNLVYKRLKEMVGEQNV